MNNYLQPGEVMPYTNGTGSAISSGDVVVIGNMLTVATVDMADGAVGEVATRGVFSLPKASAAVIGQGQTLTWDVSAGNFDDAEATAATGDLTGACAVAFKAAAATTTTVEVLLTGVPATVN
jgi:predicted RecA/RadA family phage recombinase